MYHINVTGDSRVFINWDSLPLFDSRAAGHYLLEGAAISVFGGKHVCACLFSVTGGMVASSEGCQNINFAQMALC